MIVCLIEDALRWPLFPGFVTVLKHGSSREISKACCYEKRAKEAIETERALAGKHEEIVVFCEEKGWGLDLSEWKRVYRYLVEERELPPNKKLSHFFATEAIHDPVTAACIVSESLAAETWATGHFKKKSKTYKLCEAVASGRRGQVLKEWFSLDEEDRSSAIPALCKLVARAKDLDESGSEWAKRVATHAKKTCDLSSKPLDILTRRGLPESFRGLAFALSLSRSLK